MGGLQTTGCPRPSRPSSAVCSCASIWSTCLRQSLPVLHPRGSGGALALLSTSQVCSPRFLVTRRRGERTRRERPGFVLVRPRPAVAPVANFVLKASAVYKALYACYA